MPAISVLSLPITVVLRPPGPYWSDLPLIELDSSPPTETVWLLLMVST